MPAPDTYAWPPPCPACEGGGIYPPTGCSAPDGVRCEHGECESCWGEGDAVEWCCHECSTVIDVLERPARAATVERLGRRVVVYTCADCDGAATLPGMER